MNNKYDWFDEYLTKEIAKAAQDIPVPNKALVWKEIEK
jgi:hypothetical protein